MKKLLFNSFGAPQEVLQLVEDNVPEIKEDEILVKMRFSPINPYELHIIRGENFDLPSLPSVPGHEGVGIVTKVGAAVNSYQVGQRVVVGPVILQGTWQDYVKGKVEAFYAIPDGVSDESAAVMVNAISAYVALTEHLKIQPGQWLLCTAATTDVGQILLQFESIFGFKLINVVRNSEGENKMKALGAKHIVNTSTQDVNAEINRLTNGQGLNGIFDLVGGALGTQVINSLRYRGRMLFFSKMSGEQVSIDPMHLMGKKLLMEGFTGWHWAYGESHARKQATMDALFSLMEAGRLKLNPGTIYPFAEYEKAITHALSSGKKGKVLLSRD